jgi:hypothetical protein
MRVPFGELLVKYLQAKQMADELAYRLPLQEYYQKDRGLTWSDLTEAEYRAVVREDYDIHSEWPEEKYRPMIVDCQKDLAKFYYGVFAVSLNGESRELARGEAKSFTELADIQKKWKVRDQHVFVDVGYQMTKVLRECVSRGHQGQIKVGGKLKTVWFVGRG